MGEGKTVTGKAYAEMQQRTLRQQHAAAHLQTAHNRALRRLRKASQDLADLKRVVETYGGFGSPLHRAYIRWCGATGTPTPEARAARRCEAMIKAAAVPKFEIGRDLGWAIQLAFEANAEAQKVLLSSAHRVEFSS